MKISEVFVKQTITFGCSSANMERTLIINRVDFSVLSVYNKTRDVFEIFSSAIKYRQMADRLFGQKRSLRTRAFRAQNRDERRFARDGVASNRLAGFLFGPFGVEQIINDLERQPQIVRIGTERVAVLHRGFTKNGARFCRRCDQFARFHALQARDRADVERRRFGDQVEHLASHHTLHARRPRERGDKTAAHLRVFVRARIGEDFERESEQSVAREDGRRFVEFLMHRRAAAAQVGIVHRGKIVVDQRIAMHTLDGGRRAQRAFVADAEDARRRHHEKRAQAFAAVERSVTHRLEQLVFRKFGAWQKAFEGMDDGAGGFGHGGSERGAD